MIVKVIAVVLGSILSFSIAFPAVASVCRTYNGHQICILSLHRSAKNYWEYRADVSIDGVKEDTQIYNCRDRVKLRKDRVASFKSGYSGELVCSFFKRSS